MKKMTKNQIGACTDALVNGELSRATVSLSAGGVADFQPGQHPGQTIASLINRGLLEATDSNHNGYPTRVQPTAQLTWDLINENKP